MCEDINIHQGHDDFCTNCENFVLQDIQSILNSHGKRCHDFGLRTPPSDMLQMAAPYSDVVVERNKGTAMRNTLNTEQVSAFDSIMTAVGNDNLPQRTFFLDGPGGSGKTYLYRTLLSNIRGDGANALPVASTGIVANLLDGGRTYHSQFKLPIPLLDTSTSSMRMTSPDAEIIRKAKIIIWDEATMAPSAALKAINRLLQEIMQNTRTFGGKVLLLGGDFRQILPVVPHGSRAAIVEASIKSDDLWEKFQVLRLKNNVRSVDADFSDWLMNLGNGELTNNHGLSEDTIPIPDDLICKDDIIKEIFGDQLAIENVAQFSKKAILCPKNTEAEEINKKVLDLFHGNTVTYLSSDSIDDSSDEDNQHYPIEFLNECTPSGMPVHKMSLKIGAIIMLIRNLNTKRGLCNGTRLIITDLKPNLIIASVLAGSAENQVVFIPRVDLAPTNPDLPFVLRRRQFPIKLAFAMTINKSQGQTLEKVGIYLPEPVFSHGQLYVAFSRARRAADIKVKILDGPFQGKLVAGCETTFTRNVVFKEIFSK